METSHRPSRAEKALEHHSRRGHNLFPVADLWQDYRLQPVSWINSPYSEEARKAKFSGTVLLSVDVDAQGNTRDVRVVQAARHGLG